MTPEDEAHIRSMPWKGGPDPDLVIRIADLWNMGYSTNHIVQALDLPDNGAVLRPLASLRTRTDVELRKLGATTRAGAPEHPDWWTAARTVLAKSLWEGGEIRNKLIAERLHTCEAAIAAKVATEGWTRITMSATKNRDKKGIRPVDRVIASVTAVGKGVVFDPLPGTEPKPFWQVALKGECNFILGDNPGSMADALCCAAETAPGEKYCPVHKARGVTPLASGRPRNGTELARSLRKYA